MAGHRKSGQLRIIAGDWRGRRLPVPSLPGLRPTGDRIRETLFNWLAPYLAGANCLDLFAGSGALGLEALSRGAAACDFVEINEVAAQVLRDHLRLLSAESQSTVTRGNAEMFLAHAPRRYDIAFLDPPFAADLLEPCASLLSTSRVLAPDALVYVERDAAREVNLPGCWEPLREKRTGNVAYALFRASE